jgi:hypothetical protein
MRDRVIQGGEGAEAPSRSLPVIFVSAEQFIDGLRDTGLAEYVLKLRNTALRFGYGT